MSAITPSPQPVLCKGTCALGIFCATHHFDAQPDAAIIAIIGQLSIALDLGPLLDMCPRLAQHCEREGVPFLRELDAVLEELILGEYAYLSSQCEKLKNAVHKHFRPGSVIEHNVERITPPSEHVEPPSTAKISVAVPTTLPHPVVFADTTTALAQPASLAQIKAATDARPREMILPQVRILRFVAWRS